MATHVMTDPFISIDGTDLSQYAHELTVEYTAEEKDDTTYGQGTRSFAPGTLKNWTVSISWKQDFGAGGPDATLFALLGTAFPIIIRPDSGAVSTTNPEYTGDGVLLDAGPVGGTAVGDITGAKSTIKPAKTSPDLARATS